MSYLKNYDLIGSIGKGTYGQVYLGIDHNTREKVAIKKSSNVNKAAKEAKLLKDLKKHKHLLEYKEFFIEGDHSYLITEYIEGKPLGYVNKDYQIIGQKFSKDTSIKLTIQILKALHYLHSIGITHNDIKPQNIILGTTSKNHLNIKIIDFGSAKVSGPPPYKRNRDLYKTSLVCIFLLNGEIPFTLFKTREPSFPLISNKEIRDVLLKTTNSNKKEGIYHASALIRQLKEHL